MMRAGVKLFAKGVRAWRPAQGLPGACLGACESGTRPGIHSPSTRSPVKRPRDLIDPVPSRALPDVVGKNARKAGKEREI
jgi:hypothetical protein